MNYQDFLKSKQKRIIESGFEVKKLNDHLFPFQDFIVRRALRAGKHAIFADTGLGKTIMQIEWAHQVVLHTKEPVLILAPLAVTTQTIEEGKKFNIKVKRYKDYDGKGIYITNYEQLNNIDTEPFIGIILDESSILKNFNGKYRTQLINTFIDTPYKLACTATPSPNDPMELGNHAQFLDVMSYNEMLAMYFIHDSADTGQWRLKGHAVELFYEFVSTWSIMLNKPGDIGFSNDGFNLPALNINQLSIETPTPQGLLFGGSSVNATDFNRTLRDTEQLRLIEVVKIIKSIGDEQIIVWCKQNEEAKTLHRILIENSYNSRNVQGSDSPEKKENDLIDFAHGKYKIMVTKTQIASFGMNFQNCHYQIFASLDFSFESVYQAIRRSWRFMQTKEVNIWMITTDRMINVVHVINDKEKQFKTMQTEITKAVNKNIKGDITQFADASEDVKTDQYWVMRGDCVQKIKAIHDDSIDLMIFSPPFADLYTYSNYIEDMGNVADYDEFVNHFGYLVKELKRILKPGRLCAVHCMDLPTLKSRDGYMGIRRFSSKIADIFENEDMFLHSEFTVWKDPLLAAVRTKALGLAHKQVTKDMSMIRMGLADRVMVFKKKGDNQTPIQLSDKRFSSYIPMHEYDKFPRTPEEFNEFWGYNPDSSYDRITQYSHQVWQRYASPVWMDIDVTNVLQYTTARDQNDEKHICPLQLDVIKRVILLYSNEGETVLSPFGGIGSEGYQALMMDRKSISIELKKSYFDINVRNHRNAVEQKTQSVFQFDINDIDMEVGCLRD